MFEHSRDTFYVSDGISFSNLRFENDVEMYGAQTTFDIETKVTNKTVINRLATLVKNGFVIPNLVKERIRSYELSDFTKQNEKEIRKLLK